MKSIEPYILNYKKNVLSIPPLKEWAFRTIICNIDTLPLEKSVEVVNKSRKTNIYEKGRDFN